MVRLTDRPDMTIDVYLGCKTKQQQPRPFILCYYSLVYTYKAVYKEAHMILLLYMQTVLDMHDLLNQLFSIYLPFTS